MKRRVLVLSLAVLFLFGALMLNSVAQATTAQTKCPVMGGTINPDLHVDYQGQRIYFCCPECPGTFQKDPAKYMKKLEDAGVILEKAAAAG